MSIGRRSGPVRLLWFLVIALAVIYIAAFLAVASVRLAYPYEVDNLEGHMLAMVLRVVHGEALYARPSVDYTAFCYPPLYFHVAAAVMRVLGGDYAALRVVSLIATLATAATIYAVLRRDRARRWIAGIAVAVFIGAYARTHHAGDAGRVDALALALGLGALALMYAGTSRRGAALAGCLGGLAILTKQPMAMLVASAAISQLVHGPRVRGLVFVAATAVTVVVALATMGLLGDRWLVFYTLHVPASHPLRAWDLAVLGPVFLATTLPIALVAPLVDARTRRGWLTQPWAVATIAYVAMALLARAKIGGAANVFLPVVALAAIQLGHYLERIHDRRPVISLALAAGQLAVLWWSPLAVWPSASDEARGDRLVAQIAALPGDVYVPAFPAYAVRAGKPWHAHFVALCDLNQLAPVLQAELAGQLAEHRFAAVLPVAHVEREPGNPCVLPGVLDHYRVTGRLETADPPPDIATVIGGPQLFDLVHGGQLDAILQPRAPDDPR